MLRLGGMLCSGGQFVCPDAQFGLFIGKSGSVAVCGICSSCRISLREVPGVLPGVLLLSSVALLQFVKAGEQLFGFAFGLTGVVDCAKAALAVVNTRNVTSVGTFMTPFSVVAVQLVAPIFY